MSAASFSPDGNLTGLDSCGFSDKQTGMTKISERSAAAPLTGNFQIGDWLAEPEANRLVRAGRETSVEPKVMDLLALLASAPGKVFSREEIDDALWPGVIVGEDTLARAVSKLRRALGDVANDPAFIETIPKRGYRVIAPVEPLTAMARKTPSAKTSPIVSLGMIALPAAFLLAVAISILLVRGNNMPAASSSPAVETTERAHDLYMQFTRADNEAAIALYERAIATDPHYAPAQAGLANALVQRVIRWQSQPGADPSATTLADALAAGFMSTDNAKALLARAIDLGERAVRLSPQDADTLKALGFAYSAAGDLDRAREIYSRAVEIDEDAWEVMINLGEIASITGEEAASLDWFERAYGAMDRSYNDEPQRIGPWRAPLGILIGDGYAKMADRAAAEAWYRRVLDQTPMEPEATARLAGLLREQGADDEARRLCSDLTARIGDFDGCAIATK